MKLDNVPTQEGAEQNGMEGMAGNVTSEWLRQVWFEPDSTVSAICSFSFV